MFASDVRSTVQFGDVEVVIRKLSGRSLEKAREAKQIATAAQLRAYGGELLKALRDENVSAAADSLKAKKADPEAARKLTLDSFDRESVLTAGIVSWNHKAKLPEAIADLDEPTSQRLFEAIIDLSLPAPEVVEAVEGNG